MKIIKSLLAGALLATAMTATAVNYHPWGLDFSVNAGINLGGTTPLPLPAEIRKINHFDPNLNLSIGFIATKWLPGDKYGISTGLRFEEKSMDTKATVKNYGMTILQDGESLSGRWTGRVTTQYSSSQLAIPILFTMHCNNRLDFSAGPYLAFAFNNTFSGYVHDGYLREGDPTGDKYEFDYETQATYDFSDELRKFQWGLQAGVSWKAVGNLRVNGRLEWGLNDIFNSSFKTVTFNMYPIYANIGFGYAF